MATTAQSIIDTLQKILVDVNVRWATTTEVLVSVNAAVRAISEARPDSTNVVGELTLVAGTKQTLPTGASALVDVMHNVDGRAVTHVPMRLLDAQSPNWHIATAAVTKHYCYDPRSPRTFYVYPPATAGAEVVAKYQMSPTAVAAADPIPIGDEWVNAIREYALYLLYLKDADYSPTNARALMHMGHFKELVGLKTGADGSNVPSVAEAA